MPMRCVVGGSRAAREALARHHADAAGHPVVEPPPVWRWTFERHILPDRLAQPSVIWLPDLHGGFPSGQTPGTRLVLTQSTYQLQRWLDWLDSRPETLVIAHASRSTLRSRAAEAFTRRGPWSRIDLIELDGDADDPDTDSGSGLERLRTAFERGSLEERLVEASRAAAEHAENPALQLACASALMEQQELQPAQDALERALALAPDWEAVWFEYGKLWLRADDLERAADHFAEAARLMPSFAAALSNLGAALAEVDRVDEAIAALRQALNFDPDGFPILNNLGVICREQGRLDDAIEAGRRVIQLAPTFVFGYYNLAHALFLQGRFADSRDAYRAGLERDPQKNAVQACRSAVARAAAGDPSAAVVADLRALAESLPDDSRERVFSEAEAALAAVAALGGPHGGSVGDTLAAVRAIRGGGYST